MNRIRVVKILTNFSKVIQIISEISILISQKDFVLTLIRDNGVKQKSRRTYMDLIKNDESCFSIFYLHYVKLFKLIEIDIFRKKYKSKCPI